MSLRSRLALAMMMAALLPTAVVVGVPLLRAEARAREEQDRRLDLAQRLASFLVHSFRGDTAARVERAAEELGRDRAMLAAVLRGPEEVARSAVRSLAERLGLDHLEVLDEAGVVLCASAPEVAAGSRSSLADLPEGEASAGALPAAEARAAFLARRVVAAAAEPLQVAGGRLARRELIASIAGITGQPTALLDGEGRAVESEGSSSQPVVTADVPLGDGWSVRVSAPEADVEEERRDLLGTFARIAPLALVGAFAVGVFLADRISRPIRALATRADEIAARGGGFQLPELLDRDRDEGRRLTRSFERMLESLSESERQRLAAERIAAWQEVARRIAHEVKNPLSPMKLAVENLRRTREKAPAELDRALAEETATILEEVESLRRLVDEFSEFARLPGPQPLPCDPREVVQQALALFAPRIASLGVRVEQDDAGAPERIVADAEQLGRALKNVVANALDALEPVADRSLRIALRGAGAGHRALLVIEVRDSGVGFAPEALRRLFEPYFTTRLDHGGTGLGMAIAYRIVSEHGGTIEARANSPAPGATIAIRLPVEGPRA
jgi:signal transduction histidine kinase